MKDASSTKRSRPNSDLEENDPAKRGPDSNNKTEKHKRKKLRKRQSSSSPDEDIIDGFVIASYSNLRYLEVVSSNTPDCLPLLDKEQNEQPVQEESSKVHEIEEELPRLSNESNEVLSDLKTSENAVVRESSNGKVTQTEIDLSRQSPGQLTDDSSDSGNSGKGYICDGESEDELVPQEKKPKSSLTSVTEAKKDVIPIKVDLSKDEDSVKNEKPFPIGSDTTQKSISSPKSSSFHTPALSFSSSSSLTITQSSRPVIPQSSWLPRLSSTSFKKPVSVIEPCCGSASYSGTEALHQELNNRFLQSHSELDRNSQHPKPTGHEMHQHSHLHHHQHQHQHTHYYPSPLLGQPYYPTPTPVPGVLSPFSTPVPTFGGSHVMSPFNKKTGKWCAAHVHIAWKTYYQQKREQTKMAKDPHAKPEQISISKPSSTIIPPYPPRHMSPSDLGYHSPHLHSSRFSDSPFGKPPVLIGWSSASNTAVTSSISAFSSVSSPPARRAASPDVVPRVSSSLGIHGKRLPSSGPSTLYPWLKSERKTPELDKDKPSIHITKREFQSKSPAQPSNNFSIQALAGERSDTVRPSPLGLDSTRTHSSREHRPCEPRSFMDNPLVPSLTSLDKRPIDYHRPSAGSIDLNRNSLYRRFEPPMHALYSHHVTPHMAGYHYPGSSFLTDYHGAPGHGMLLGTRDPMSSLVRTSDTPFYVRHDFDDRMGGRH